MSSSHTSYSYYILDTATGMVFCGFKNGDMEIQLWCSYKSPELVMEFAHISISAHDAENLRLALVRDFSRKGIPAELEVRSLITIISETVIFG